MQRAVVHRLAQLLQQAILDPSWQVHLNVNQQYARGLLNWACELAGRCGLNNQADMLLCIPSPSSVGLAEAALKHGFRPTHPQLLSAAMQRVLGVEEWVKESYRLEPAKHGNLYCMHYYPLPHLQGIKPLDACIASGELPGLLADAVCLDQLVSV